MRTVGGALRRTAWLGPATLVGLVACAGDPFVFGGDAGTDALMDTPAKSLAIACGGQMCMRSDVPPKSCCVRLNDPSMDRCTGGSCNCDTQLACASSANCPGLKPVCCIEGTVDTSCTMSPMNTVFGARCVVPGECVAPSVRLCNMASSDSDCLPSQRCVTDPNVLQMYLLPPGQGFGVCSP